MAQIDTQQRNLIGCGNRCHCQNGAVTAEDNDKIRFRHGLLLGIYLQSLLWDTQLQRMLRQQYLRAKAADDICCLAYRESHTLFARIGPDHYVFNRGL